MTDSVGPESQYEAYADDFLDHARDGFYNAHYDRPVCMDLLGDVAGRRVLDAACGPGLYAEVLVAAGARVIGFDQSRRMIELCRERVPARSCSRQASSSKDCSNHARLHKLPKSTPRIISA